jgi:REP element-mobilizing transposase RayT
MWMMSLPDVWAILVKIWRLFPLPFRTTSKSFARQASSGWSDVGKRSNAGLTPRFSGNWPAFFHNPRVLNLREQRLDPLWWQGEPINGESTMNEIESVKMPQKCIKCAKSSGPNIHSHCNFCRDLEFDEAVFCHLNRCIQNPTEFSCYAFQPILKLIGTSEQKDDNLSGPPKAHPKRESSQSLLHSDRIKYKRALALQKLARHPDDVFMELKYHFAWNVIYRRPVFSPTNDFFDFVDETFMGCGDLVGGFASLLYLAPDHIHLHVDSDGELSVEEMVQEMKRYSNNAILTEFSEILETFDEFSDIWDAAYFAETVG